MQGLEKTYNTLKDLHGLTVIEKKEEKPKSKKRSIIDLDEFGNITTIRVSQSVIKRFLYKTETRESCPKKEYHHTVIRDIETPPTESMENGNYFETWCLGASVGGDQTLDLPRLKNGEKSTDQKRIDEQIMKFAEVADKHEMIISSEATKRATKNIQLHFEQEMDYDEFDEKIIVTMNLDLLSPLTLNGVDYPTAIIDLKLTKNIHSTFGEFGWGNVKYMDHIQAFVYSFMLGFPFFYLVFDYKKGGGEYEFFPINTNVNHRDKEKAAEARTRLQDTHYSIRKTCTDILTYHRLGWHTNPTYDNCRNCQLFDCPDKGKNQEI